MKQRPMQKYSQFTGSYVRLACVLKNKALKLVLAFSAGSLLKCSTCLSSLSYDDCQKTLTVVNCTNPSQACYQAEVKSEKGDVVEFIVQKGCLQKDFCDAYSKGDIGFCNTKRELNFTVDCKGKCCFDGDECNKGNLLNLPIDQGKCTVFRGVIL